MASDNKYDRQLRLWGAHGQKMLSEAKICLVNASATGAEALKNLVLPGCGFITIVDDARVQARDVGNNFFVPADAVGQSRAAVVLTNLLEMNEDVRGEAVEESADAALARDAGFFARFSLVILTQTPYLSDKTTAAVAAACWDAGVPLILVRTLGLLGVMRTVVGEHRILESKPDPQNNNLRIANPWPELRDFAMSIDLSAMDSHQHGHVPWAVIVIQALAKWRDAHGGASPRNFAEKEEFWAGVKADSREYGAELNFVEACTGKGNEAFRPPLADRDDEASERTKALLADPAAATLTAESRPFWFIVRAIADFAEATGELPVAGSLPDMTSTPDMYVSLQRLYKEKAAADCADVRARVAALLAGVGLPEDHVPGEWIPRACANANFMRLLRTRSLADEAAAAALDAEAIGEELEELGWTVEDDEERAKVAAQKPFCWYVALRAADRFTGRTGRVAGAADEEVEADAAALAEDVAAEKAAAAASMGGLDIPVGADHAAEIARYGGAEPHNVAAVLGGVASQEAVKLITHQYEPLDNTFIFNGITGESAVYRC
uniref:NEDD8-activating enzyme E1 regulatory subunit n=1 Tax=Bicosoecida sp. CB-2014 TaxID=1486930 RepID=A0A7S1C6B9_9STRA